MLRLKLFKMWKRFSVHFKSSFDWIKKFFTSRIVLAVLIAAISGVSTQYFMQYSRIHDNLADIISFSFELFEVDEMVNDTCQTYIVPFNKEGKHFSTFELDKMAQMHNEMERTLNQLIANTKEVGKLISAETYKAIQEFTCWNNVLLSKRVPICYAGLKEDIDIDLWRNRIIEQITKDIIYQLKPSQMVKNIFTPLYDLRDEKYPTIGCKKK